jgi:ADP-heptose:LPS heptosyltransferase
LGGLVSLPDGPPPVVKPKLLVLELWNVGDLAITTPFLRQACEKFEVTLLAKPFAADLHDRFWPKVRVVPFNAPWTAFDHKYRLWAWPWATMFRLWRQLRRERFDVALSGRPWDPRDHFLLWLSGARARLGFPRIGSHAFLTRSLSPPPPLSHRYDYWRVIARALDLELEERDRIKLLPRPAGRTVFIHSGAGQLVRVWPLERYRNIAENLRARGHIVRVVCNPEQRDWWLAAGEKSVATPRTISALLDLMADAAVFIGNDSGPGHLAAFSGIPTFTFFGPQVPEWFVPLHPAAEWVEGKACPYKPCSDSCMFAVPLCLGDVSTAEVWPQVEAFVRKHIPLKAGT